MANSVRHDPSDAASQKEEEDPDSTGDISVSPGPETPKRVSFKTLIPHTTINNSEVFEKQREDESPFSSEDELICIKRKKPRKDERSEPDTPEMPQFNRPPKPTIYDAPGPNGHADISEVDLGSETESESQVHEADRIQSMPEYHQAVETIHIDVERNSKMNPIEVGSGSEVDYYTDEEQRSPRLASRIAKREIAKIYERGDS